MDSDYEDDDGVRCECCEEIVSGETNLCEGCGQCQDCLLGPGLCEGCNHCIGGCSPAIHCEACGLCRDCGDFHCTNEKCDWCDDMVEDLCSECGCCWDCAVNKGSTCCAYMVDIEDGEHRRCRRCREWRYGVCEHCDYCWSCDDKKNTIDNRCKQCYKRIQNKRMKILHMQVNRGPDVHELGRLNLDILKNINKFLIHGPPQ